MGCNCKNKLTPEEVESNSNNSIPIKIIITISKIFIFIVASIIGSLLATPFTIVLIFKTVFNGSASVNINNLLMKISKYHKDRKEKKEEEEEEEEYEIEEYENEEDLILLNEEKWYKK